MSYSTKADHTLLYEQYNQVKHSQLFDEQIQSLDDVLCEVVDEIKVNEGLAGLGTRMKDRLSGAASQAGAMVKNVGALGKAVTQGKTGQLQDPQAAARQKKINNVVGRFNRDMTALVPDLEKQHPEIHAAVTMLNQAQNTTGANQTSDQSQNQTTSTATDTPTTPTTTDTPVNAEEVPTPVGPVKVGGTPTPGSPSRDKESLGKQAIKKPGQMLKSMDKFAKDLESSTASGGIEGAVADASTNKTSATKDKENLRNAYQTVATPTSPTTTPVSPAEPTTTPTAPAEPETPAEPTAEPETPVEPTAPAEPETPVEPTAPAEPETPVFEPGEEVVVRTKKNPTGQGGVVKQINPNGSILVTTPGNPSGYAFNPDNVSKSPRVTNTAVNESLLGGCGFMSNKWLNL